MQEKTIYSFRNLEIKVSRSANEDIIYLLNHSVQGSEGGMRYSLQNVGPRIEAYGDNIRLISLYKNGQLTGTIGACFRITGQGALQARSSHLRYLAFQSSYQANPEGFRSRRKREREDKDDSFRHKTLEIFSKPHLLDLQDVYEGDKHIMYAFVESMNERSKSLIHQAGFEYVRSFLTVAFSRFSPVCSQAVSLLAVEEKPLMKNLLLEYYSGYSLFTPEYSFYNDRYYVMKEKGEIVAGVCAIPSVYKVYDIPGVWGWIIMKVLPHMPYFRRLFRPGEFRFLVFDAIYCKEGHEKKLASLFESVCAVEGFNTGLTWLDDRSTLFDKLRTEVKMGALNRMLNAKPGLVYIRFVNYSEKEKDPFFEAPAYISGFDFS